MITNYQDIFIFNSARRRRLRSANLNRLTVPRCQLSTYGCRAFYNAGPAVWNSLPDELRNSDSFDSFKRFLKTILFSSALEVIFNEMRYINLRFTYLLTYLILQQTLMTSHLHRAKIHVIPC